MVSCKMGVEIQPQSRRRFLRSGLQLPAQKAAVDIYLCRQAPLSHRLSVGAVPDGEQFSVILRTVC